MSAATDAKTTAGTVIPFKPRQRTFECEVSDLERLHLLAIRRADWNRLHPDATPDETDVAHRQIAEGLGL